MAVPQRSPRLQRQAKLPPRNRSHTPAGGEFLLDERVRRGGSHHQKLVILRRPRDPRNDVVFVGGIDLSHGRRDTEQHAGDSQAIKLDRRYGPRPPWHDVHLEVHGPAVGDFDFTFRERWSDPTPLDHSSPARAWLLRATSRGRTVRPLPEALPDPPPAGNHAVQVLRSYPARRPPYPFAPRGERSIALAFAKAVRRARKLIYVEDQYFWSGEIAAPLADALRRHPELQLIVVTPRYPDKDGRLSGPPSRIAQQEAMTTVLSAGKDRVAFYDLENDAGTPVYVHAKIFIIDDVWATVGSDNLNRRSWTHDSEVSCAVIDGDLDDRPPVDPGGLGDCARGFARRLRLTLWAEHLGKQEDDGALLGLENALEIWRATATRLEQWDRDGSRGPRPPGRVRPHRVDPVAARNRWWALALQHLLFDPDGRPLALRRRRQF